MLPGIALIPTQQTVKVIIILEISDVFPSFEVFWCSVVTEEDDLLLKNVIYMHECMYAYVYK